MNTPGQMHPEDARNLIIFMVSAILLWLAFDHFVMAPRKTEYQQTLQAQQAAAATAAPVLAEEIVKPREKVLAETKRIEIDTPEIAGSISLIGNRVDDISLKNYFEQADRKDQVVLMMPSGTPHPHYAEFGWLGDNINVPSKDTVWTVTKGDKLTPASPITVEWDNGQGVVFEKTISIDSQFMITVAQRVANKGQNTVTLYPYAAIVHRGVPPRYKGDTMVHEGAMGYIGDELHETRYSDLLEEEPQQFQSKNGWIGFGQKYWLTALIPSQQEEHTYRIVSTPPKTEKSEPLFQTDIRGAAKTIKAGEELQETTSFYVGAKKVSLLEKYEDQLGVKHFDLAVDFGMLYFLTRPMYFLLTLFNTWTGNFGVAIILLTLVVRGAVFPLANTSYRSFAMLKKVSPKMAEIREKHGHDKMRLQQELVKLYETEKVNPLAGCFPILIQIPIFFAVYKVISIAIEMRHAPFFGWIHDLSARDPLSVFNGFGLLPYDVPAFLMIGPWSVAMMVLMLIQRSMNPPPQDATQRAMINFMPFMMTYILASFPSGLVIYWAFSNLFSVVQQYGMMRSMGVPVYLFSPDAAREHEAQHSTKMKEALDAARAEKEAVQVKARKTDEVIEEALFDSSEEEKK